LEVGSHSLEKRLRTKCELRSTFQHETGTKFSLRRKGREAGPGASNPSIFLKRGRVQNSKLAALFSTKRAQHFNVNLGRKFESGEEANATDLINSPFFD